jgi:hypothetical protein
LSDVYLFNASWIFFATWAAVLVALCVVAFGRDLRAAAELIIPAGPSRRNLHPFSGKPRPQ